MTVSAWMDSALTELERLHALKLAELAEIETAINALHRLRGTAPPAAPAAAPPPVSLPRRRAAEARWANTPKGLPDAIVDALRAGPLPIAELLERAQTSRWIVSNFIDKGLLVATGHTTARRVSLPAPPPAKEAP